MVGQLAARAQHHTAGVQRAEGLLKRQGGERDPERCEMSTREASLLRMCVSQFRPPASVFTA